RHAETQNRAHALLLGVSIGALMVHSRSPDGKEIVPMVATPLPPLLSSDGHLEVRPERWTPRMPARYRGRAPRTIKLPDVRAALLVEGQPPYPAPFLDLRAGRTNETWQPFGVTVEDTAGVGPPEQRLREQDMDGLHAEVLFPNMQVGPRLWRALPDDD